MATLTTDGTSQVKLRTTAVERDLLAEDDITPQNTIHEALISEATPSIGDNAFFLKTENDDPPFIVKELVARLRGLPTPGCQSLSASPCVFGDIIVDFVGTEGVHGRVQITLTIKEFRTLEFPIKNARRAISRDDPLNKVWGHNTYPCTRTPGNHILRLRQKLETDPSNPARLVTIRGLGYSSCLRAGLRT